MSARAASRLDHQSAPAQLSLPALVDEPEPAPLPDPVSARPCRTCGWLVLAAEAACPICRTPAAPREDVPSDMLQITCPKDNLR
ncbi:MAG TPA: hypothetical protein VIK91_00785 [Nannocystis sp.]